MVITHLVFEQARSDLLADSSTDGSSRVPPPPTGAPSARVWRGSAMPVPDTGQLRPLYRQFPTALRFSLRDQTRNRLAGLLLALFVPARGRAGRR
ncbi:hypothetical protein WJ438_34970 [Streptomyces sp. GD-15H]|uniref:hypothetical protein n=1 Tax=Streptomyces sp. GD-15H TaxID=3129112 RepID=UPI0032489008